MTERLYYENTTLIEFTAHVVARRESERGPAVQLDRSAFYPTSGGQPHDTGTLNGIAVLDVWEEGDGAVWHLVERPLESDNVSGKIDWKRRFDHMQQHTGQHLLSAAFVQALDAQTTSFHLGSEASTIDLEIADLTWEEAFQVEDAVNSVVWEDRVVAVHVLEQNELARVPLRKPPQVSGKIRVVWVEGYDASACGGTHVARTGSVGVVKISGIERYKGGVRVAFLCGGRALKDYQRVLRSLQQTSVDLSVHQDELHEAVARLQDEARESRRALNKAQGELLAFEADRLWNEAPVVDGRRRIVAHWEDRAFSDVRRVALQLRERPGTQVLLAASEAKGVKLVCARSDDLAGTDAASVLRVAIEKLGGRGGGSESIAQGGAPDQPGEVIMKAMMDAAL